MISHRFVRCLLLGVLSLSIVSIAVRDGQAEGIYTDLGRPVIGAWQRNCWLVHDPVLKRDVLWSQECSQDGAILYALELDGRVIEQHPFAAREVGEVMVDKNHVLYIYSYSGLNHPGNELFRFDPRKRKVERLGLARTLRNRCVGGAIGADGNIYIGTHQQARLFRFEPQADRWTDMGIKLPGQVLPNQNAWLENMQLLPSGNLLAKARRSLPGETIEIELPSGKFRKIDGLNSRTPVVAGKRILDPTKEGFDTFDLKYQKIESITAKTLTCERRFPSAAKLELVVDVARQRLLGLVGDDLVTLDLDERRMRFVGTLPFRGAIRLTSDQKRAVVVSHALMKMAFVELDSAEPKFEVVPMKYRGQKGTQICGLNRGEDGTIYGTNIIGMHLFRIDTRSDRMTDLGHVGWSGAEVYNSIQVGGKVYFGTYGGGNWGVYDPKQPWKIDHALQGRSAELNPRWLGRLGGDTADVVNRPFEYVKGPQGEIFIACRANYGHRGGALARFNPKGVKFTAYPDKLRSVQTVTADDKYVFGGTNVRGGRGSGVFANEATLFVFDPERGKRIFELAVVRGAKAIVSARYNPKDKRVYATTDNQILIRFHPRRFIVEKTWKLKYSGTPLAGVPEDVGMLHITAAQDGNVYGIAYRALYRLNVKSEKIEYLETPPRSGLYQIVEGRPGEFYMGAGTHILKYTANPAIYYR